MMQMPPNELSLEEDAEWAIVYMELLEEYEQQHNNQTVADKIFHPDPVRSNLNLMNRFIANFTQHSVQQVFHYKDGRLYPNETSFSDLAINQATCYDRLPLILLTMMNHIITISILIILFAAGYFTGQWSISRQKKKEVVPKPSPLPRYKKI